MPAPDVRTLEEYSPIARARFRDRFLARFHDPAFDDMAGALDALEERAWDAYSGGRKWPRTERAGPDFADPDTQLGVEWLAARRAVLAAQAEHDDASAATRILVVNGSTRTEHSCPGEVSKTRRLVEAAVGALSAEGVEVDMLDLSKLAYEPLKVIHPCKACVSTAMPLCHWPCSCYPNHGLGQVNDWMNDLYPRWVRAHGVFILCPVHWYEAPASLKLMMDRLVCADGGNPDPTTTGVKDPARAKEVELAGWHYPKHLAGRAFAVYAHGDADGAREVRNALRDWLLDMALVQAGATGAQDSYIGYYEPYATSHQALDEDEAVFGEVRNGARSLLERVRQLRSEGYTPPDAGLTPPRQK